MVKILEATDTNVGGTELSRVNVGKLRQVRRFHVFDEAFHEESTSADFVNNP